MKPDNLQKHLTHLVRTVNFEEESNFYDFFMLLVTKHGFDVRLFTRREYESESLLLKTQQELTKIIDSYLRSASEEINKKIDNPGRPQLIRDALAVRQVLCDAPNKKRVIYQAPSGGKQTLNMASCLLFFSECLDGLVGEKRKKMTHKIMKAILRLSRYSEEGMIIESKISHPLEGCMRYKYSLLGGDVDLSSLLPHLKQSVMMAFSASREKLLSGNMCKTRRAAWLELSYAIRFSQSSPLAWEQWEAQRNDAISTRKGMILELKQLAKEALKIVDPHFSDSLNDHPASSLLRSELIRLRPSGASKKADDSFVSVLLDSVFDAMLGQKDWGIKRWALEVMKSNDFYAVDVDYNAILQPYQPSQPPVVLSEKNGSSKSLSSGPTFPRFHASFQATEARFNWSVVLACGTFGISLVVLFFMHRKKERLLTALPEKHRQTAMKVLSDYWSEQQFLEGAPCERYKFTGSWWQLPVRSLWQKQYAHTYIKEDALSQGMTDRQFRGLFGSLRHDERPVEALSVGGV